MEEFSQVLIDVGVPTPLVLDSIRKKAVPAVRSKPKTSLLYGLRISSCLQVLGLSSFLLSFAKDCG